MAVYYFQELFSSSYQTKFEEVLKEVHLLISAQMNEELTTSEMEEEVRKALFMMHPEKAP